MKILTQDKTTIVNIEQYRRIITVVTHSLDETVYQVTLKAIIDKDNMIDLGAYKTEKRAYEILDRIMEVEEEFMFTGTFATSKPKTFRMPKE